MVKLPFKLKVRLIFHYTTKFTKKRDLNLKNYLNLNNSVVKVQNIKLTLLT
jgi:hypothetical protein